METKAIVRGVRLSADKGRLVADLIRGKKVGLALNTLEFTQKKAAGIIKKALESAIANAEGTTELPGCALVTGSKSSVSSAWAHMAFARAALITVVRKRAPITEACGSPPSSWTYFTAISPGRMREPDTMAPKV